MRRLSSLLATALLVTAVSCGGGSSSEPANPSGGASGQAPGSLDDTGGADTGSGGSTTSSGGSTTSSTTTTLPPPPTLPDGTRSLFPEHRVVAYYGGATTPALGVLGEGTPDEAVARLRDEAAAYEAGDRPVMLALELIGTVAAASPGTDGQYRNRADREQVQKYLDAARRAGAILIIDVQPGRAPFLEEVKYYEEFLLQPDVGLAIDPEWSMGPSEVPGQVIGRTDAATINAVSQYLVDLVVANRLPEKVLVVHQFTFDMIQQPEAVLARGEVAVTFHIDGFGTPGQKLGKYAALHRTDPFANGFKLFFDEDVNRLAPEQVLGLNPTPDLITYQ